MKPLTEKPIRIAHAHQRHARQIEVEDSKVSGVGNGEVVVLIGAGVSKMDAARLLNQVQTRLSLGKWPPLSAAGEKRRAEAENAARKKREKLAEQEAERLRKARFGGSMAGQREAEAKEKADAEAKKKAEAEAKEKAAKGGA